ncbi:tetratricopeptide repeat protein [Streptomyces sp. TP-A0874]|uniref:tetratricopeptide repeat protein n=1 Tax=Streptomyces sp. TP-A0874 TaxID=549819 RepID=UPI000852ED48|nr:tetratricopeptide repeat protein [Streptomyces sp. TP-A0874]
MTDQAVGAGDRPPVAVAGALPPDGTAPAGGGLVGRARELAGLRADIRRAGLDTLAGRSPLRSRVLLIAGGPGSGRTALAEEFARQISADYPDGVLRARLSTPGGEREPTERVARELLEEIGGGAPPGADEDELTGAVRTALAGRRLLILDDAADPGQVDALIPDAPESLVLVTARGPLTGIPDVRPCTLGGLDAQAALELLIRYAGPTRIACDPRAAESLVERCAARPAALLLVGGVLAARPEASVAGLARQLRELAEEEAAAPGGDDPRLAVAFRLAYEELPPAVARTLRLLVRAPGGVADAHTAAALAGCSLATASAALRDLAARGMLRSEPGSAASPCYRLPGCLAPYLRALHQAEETPTEARLARARLLERTVWRLRSCRAAAEPPGSPARERVADLPRALRFSSAPQAAAWLDSRLPTLLSTARAAVRDGTLDTQARRLVTALARALMAHRGEQGAAAQLYPLHELVLAVAERRGLPLEQAAALVNLGDLDAGAGRAGAARHRYRAALDAARAGGDARLTARVLEALGDTYQELGDWLRAADWYGRALQLWLSRGEVPHQARLYAALATARGEAGDWDEALRHRRAAAACHRRMDDLPGLAGALSETAETQQRAGRPEDALRSWEEALSCARRAGDLRLQAAALFQSADALESLGDPAAARRRRATAEALLAGRPLTAQGTRGGAPRR